MSEKLPPMEFVKRNGLYMLAGIIVCGVAGYFIGGSEARALSGGIGGAIGLMVGGLISKTRPS